MASNIHSKCPDSSEPFWSAAECAAACGSVSSAPFGNSDDPTCFETIDFDGDSESEGGFEWSSREGRCLKRKGPKNEADAGENFFATLDSCMEACAPMKPPVTGRASAKYVKYRIKMSNNK